MKKKMNSWKCIQLVSNVDLLFVETQNSISLKVKTSYIRFCDQRDQYQFYAMT